MEITTINAELLAKMFLAGAKNLEAKKEWINELNVFPVPDGDTGTNMSMTIMSAAKEVAGMEKPQMAALAKESFVAAVELLGSYDEKKAAKVKEIEDTGDKYEDQIGGYLVKLSGQRNLTDADSRTSSMLLHCIGDFERISDHAVSVMSAAKELSSKNLHFSEKGQQELNIYAAAVLDILDTAFTAFDRNDDGSGKSVEALEEVIDTINTQVKKRHVKRLKEGKCTIEMGFILSDICTDFERVSDHCSNVAAYMLQSHDSDVDPHMYAGEMRRGDDESFKRECEKYSQKYALPQLS